MTLFMNTNGRIACPKHAGYSVKAAVEADPKATTIVTDNDVWVLLHGEELAFFKEVGIDSCENC